jgi:uncharacterized protein
LEKSLKTSSRSAAVTWLQQWTAALFLHFVVRPDDLQRLLPPRLEIDTFGRQAWLSLVFFRLKLRPAGLPFIPVLSSLRELNLRTYVRHRGQQGIYFLRMYADNRLAIRAARWLTPLCYEPATMVDCELPGLRRVECHATEDRRGSLSIEFTHAASEHELSPASLGFWLLERYRLFVERSDGALLAADVEHPPWRASSLETLAIKHTFAESLSVLMDQRPAAAHFSGGVSARFNDFRVVAQSLPNRS